MSLAQTPLSNTTRWAVWTIVLGALLSLVLPWALTHFHSGISFAETGPIGDTIGGITGPVLNFTGLLVVYFSLREQFLSNQIQIQHFAEEQQRSANENTISTAFKIIDDLRTEAQRIKDRLPLQGEGPADLTQHLDLPEFIKPNYLPEPTLIQARYSLEDIVTTEGYAFQRLVYDYFQRVDSETKVLRATLSMLLYLLVNSPLPLAQRMHLYRIVLAFYEPLVIDLLGGLEVFSQARQPIQELVNGVTTLQGDLSNANEAFLDLSIHDPDGKW
ncbi:hypothetical protein [Hymenobacter sp. 102]|uniref:hypothetical protein n=1 Tax=Hymenobacter sp. 102 TaxID=3403152 RepID=UPI003CECB85F